ncbi:MAG: DedA family protein [Phycisphaerae bacterium]|nr:DedA family protein [Phycisphaerae bacterium]
MTALFCLSFAESSFFPVPPDVLLGPLCLGNRRRSMWFATVTTAASVIGAFLGYLIGYQLIWLALKIPGITQEAIDWLAGEFEVRGQWYVFIAALTPIPFKLLTITAGFAKMNLLVFAAACLVGRAARFYFVAFMFWFIGPKALPFIDKYFNWLALTFAVLLVGGFVAVKYVF